MTGRGNGSWWGIKMAAGILLLSLGRSAGSGIRGLQKSLLPMYDPGRNFSCLDGSAVIPFERINDDYCDCNDGSDEPGTSACPNGKFFCRNVGHASHFVYSSRVNDGICDCCDGTDEWTSGACVDVCQEIGAEARAQKEKELQAVKEGHAIKLKMIEEAGQTLQDTQSQLQAKDQEVEQLRKEVDLRRTEKEAAEAPEQEALDKYRQEEERLRKEKEDLEKRQSDEEGMALFRKLDDNADGKITPDELTKEMKFDADNDGLVSLEEAAVYMADHEEFDAETFLSTAWPVMKPVIAGTPEQKRHHPHHKHKQRDPDSPKAWNEAGQEVDEDGVPIEPKEEDEEEEEGEDYDDYDEADPEVEAEDVEAPKEFEPKKYDEATQALIDIADKARKSFEEAEGRLKNLESQIHDLKDMSEGDYGEHHEFLPLKGKCFEFHNNEYVYTMCPFGSCTQKGISGGGETRLGNWDRWDGPVHDTLSRMKFSNGQTCWNGPARSVIVHLLCGTENILQSVAEPNRCEYEFVFSTPAICKSPELYMKHSEAHDEL